MKKVSFSFKYLITKYDWSFYLIPTLIVWSPRRVFYEISINFLFWELNVRIKTRKE
jgi:hypothetical protein